MDTLKRIHRKYNLYYFRKHPFLWIYAAYLTLRYVDVYEKFPAIIFSKFLKLRIHKSKGAKIEIKSQLVLEPWINGNGTTTITLENDSLFFVEGDFILGDGIKILVSGNAKLIVRGKKLSSGSGITANSVILVRENVEIGEDCIIAWDTFITDSDWHTIEGKPHTKPTYIGNHVWLGVGAKILKGTRIEANSIVTTNSVVLQNNYPERSLISGIPAQVVKSNINSWIR
jgi:acetyltransferase-like isoleucine patch superfamily enzyme